jgi:hypothetical protein
MISTISSEIFLSYYTKHTWIEGSYPHLFQPVILTSFSRNHELMGVSFSLKTHFFLKRKEEKYKFVLAGVSLRRPGGVIVREHLHS